MTTTTTGFSFNFLPEIDTENASEGDRNDEQCHSTPTVKVEANETKSIPLVTVNEASKSKRRALPFVWLTEEDFRPLLDERSTEEIVYTDISIANNNAHNSADSAATTGSSSTPTSRILAAAAAAPIKCVDLTLSSYQKAAASSGDEEVWKTTDILPGLYEGGRKVWECSLDLVQHLVQEQITLVCPLGKNQSSATTHNIKLRTDDDEFSTNTGLPRPRRPMFALELGCGHGLPGCYLLRTAMEEEQFHQSRGNGTPFGVGNDERLQLHPDASSSSFTMVMTDYNESVILDATLSNLVLNCGHIRSTERTTEPVNNNNSDDTANVGSGVLGEADPSFRLASATSGTSVSIDELAQHVLLGAGDWMDMSNQLTQQHDTEQAPTTRPTCRNKLPPCGTFDIILASETLYSQDAAHDTVRLIQRHLRPDTGVAYVATKRYYFGVNGGVDAFRFFAGRNSTAAITTTVNNSDNHASIGLNEDESNELDIETVRVIDNGSGNIREVLRVRCYASKARG